MDFLGESICRETDCVVLHCVWQKNEMKKALADSYGSTPSKEIIQQLAQSFRYGDFYGTLSSSMELSGVCPSVVEKNFRDVMLHTKLNTTDGWPLQSFF